MQEPPTPRHQERHDRAEGPERGRFVRMLAAATVHHVEGKDRQQEERQGFKSRKHAAPELPVGRVADPEIVVAGTQNARDERHGDDDIHPLVDDFAIHASHLDQHEGQDCRKNEPTRLPPRGARPTTSRTCP